MKQLIAMLVWLIMIVFLTPVYSQVNEFPYKQSFDNTFQQGTDVEFIPNWFGNLVQSNNRIFRNTTDQNNGTGALACIPITSFSGEIYLYLDFSKTKEMRMEFQAASARNSTGSRPALLFLSYSLDSGNLFSSEIQIGDDYVFANDDTPYQLYSFDFPDSADLNKDIIVKFRIPRGQSGSGTTACLLLDDFHIFTTDSIPPVPLGYKILNEKKIKIYFNEPLNQTAENDQNYLLIIDNETFNIESSELNNTYDTVLLVFKNALPNGKKIQLLINNIEDLAGNAMEEQLMFEFVFNNSVADIIFSEINFSMLIGDSLQYIEIYNRDSNEVILTGLKIKGDLDFIFPDTILKSGQYLVLAKNKDVFLDFYGFKVIEWFAGSLNKSGFDLVLQNTVNDTIANVSYTDSTAWPVPENGSASIVLCNFDSYHSRADAWSLSRDLAGYINDVPVFGTPANFYFPPVSSEIHIDTTCQFPYHLSANEFTCAKYDWSHGDSNSNTIIYETGNYYLEITNSAGTAKDTFFISKYFIHAEIMTIDTLVMKHEFFELTAMVQTNSTDTPFSYIWDFGDGSMASGKNVNHTYYESGIFNVELIAFNGKCSDTATIKVHVEETGSVNFENEKNRFIVYPNPVVGGTLMIVIENEQVKSGRVLFNVYDFQGKKLMVSVNDLKGKLVYHSEINDPIFPLKLQFNDLKEGVYLLNIENEEGGLYRGLIQILN